MRRALNVLYAASGALAAFFVCAIFVVVLAQTLLNLADKIAKMVSGAPLGLLLPSYAEFAGYFLAAASFLALASTLRAGAHIRVNLLIRHCAPRTRRWVEAWCCALATLLSGYFCYQTVLLTRDSWEYGDVSYGLIAIPIWIPQSAVSLGLVILTVALLDELQRVLRGHPPCYEVDNGLLRSGSKVER